MPDDGRRLYRFLIDELVSECRQGQGQIGPDWARAGRWKPGGYGTWRLRTPDPGRT